MHSSRAFMTSSVMSTLLANFSPPWTTPVADGVNLLHGADNAVLGAGELVDDGGNGLAWLGRGMSS